MIVTAIEPPPMIESTFEFSSKTQNKNEFKNESEEIRENYFSLSNASIKIKKSIINETTVDLKLTKKNEYKEKLNQIKKIDFESEGIDIPNEKVFQDAELLIDRLIDRDFYPNRISESAEGGLCFYFYKDSKALYFEIYNDGEKGYIIEDISKRKILKNYDISSYMELLTELIIFFS
jgi:hypothetical protein